MLSLRGVTKRYGSLVALDSVDLEFEANRTTALIGPSGCGKSTLLRLLVGLQAPDSGQVSFGEEELRPEGVEAVRRRIGYVIQDGGLFPHLTAFDNVALLARFLGWGSDRLHARIDQLIGLTHLSTSALDRYPGELSGGQRQRVSLMRALMLDPEVLLLDEPLGALDAMIRFELQEELRQIFDDLGKTVVLVTHDLAEADYLGHTIVLLRNGRVVQRGTLAELTAAPEDEFVRRFVRAQRRLPAQGEASP